MNHSKWVKIVIGFSFCVILSMLCVIALADVEINETTFPDAAFRDYIQGAFDTDQNGILDSTEIQNATIIEANAMGISSMKGLEHFTELETLMCLNNSLEQLDVSSNTKLVYLSFWGNQVSSIDVSQNPLLDTLGCGNNKLTSIVVSNNPKLKVLQCSNNLLTKLDISNTPKLESLWCDQNKLKTLDVRKCPVLLRLVNSSDAAEHPWNMYGWWEETEYGDPYPALFLDKTVKVISGESSVTVNGGIYKLNAKKTAAIFTGPKNKKASSLVIQDTVKINGKNYKVTEIADNACAGMSKLTKLTIGKNIKTIGKKAFYKCKKAATIKILGTALKTVGSDAFSGTPKKAVVTCPKKKVKAYTKLLTKAGLPKTAKVQAAK